MVPSKRNGMSGFHFHKLPADIKLDHAALIEPLAVYAMMLVALV